MLLIQKYSKKSASQTFAFCKEPNSHSLQNEKHQLLFCQPSRIKSTQFLDLHGLNAVYSSQPSKSGQRACKIKKLHKIRTKGLQNPKASKSIHKNSSACKIRGLPQNQGQGLTKCRAVHKMRTMAMVKKTRRLARASKQTQTLAKCSTFHKMRTMAPKLT